MRMADTKSFFQSTGIWGGLVSLVGGVSFAGYSLTAEDAASAMSLMQGIVAAVGGLIAIYGRVKATKRIGRAQ